MTGFKITEEDVGKIACTDDAFTTEMTCVLVTESGAVFEEIETGALYTFTLKGERTDGIAISERPSLTHWKPKLLEAPKRWWNVYRNGNGEIVTFNYETFAEAADVPPENEPIARIHAPHWHGHPEGTFHTEGED